MALLKGAPYTRLQVLYEISRHWAQVACGHVSAILAYMLP